MAHLADLRVHTPQIGIQIPRPGVPVLHTGSPPGTPGGAPITSPGATAAAAGFACPPGVGCVGLKDVAPGSLWSRIPLWAKIGGAIALAGGIGFLAYRALR